MPDLQPTDGVPSLPTHAQSPQLVKRADELVKLLANRRQIKFVWYFFKILFCDLLHIWLFHDFFFQMKQRVFYFIYSGYFWQEINYRYSTGIFLSYKVSVFALSGRSSFSAFGLSGPVYVCDHFWTVPSSFPVGFILPETNVLERSRNEVMAPAPTKYPGSGSKIFY